ncbi:MAG TPA: PIN domain-containing protein [Chthonomonadaceae bacterium]|nr:PIN domain-containing protein [Chthonomonadaceae bacterium]
MTDTLIDAGPLVAVVNRNDTNHRAAAALLRELNCPFTTTLPAITEAMYLAHARLGLRAQQALWKMLLRGDLILEHPTGEDLSRMHELMTKYADLPMDFADASLVAIAERLNLSRILTLDRDDFSVYRLHNRTPLLVIAPPLPSS